jgi:catechol 2,3-dioxygenase-like lactoylglutathione lyase family enzyme
VVNLADPESDAWLLNSITRSYPRDKVASAKFFARIFGLPFDERAVDYFAPVRVNESLTLDFVNNKRIAVHHYAFKVSEDEFDEIFARIQAEGIPYGSEPYSRQDMKINHRGGGRGVYFDDPDGHILELLTVD